MLQVLQNPVPLQMEQSQEGPAGLQGLCRSGPPACAAPLMLVKPLCSSRERPTARDFKSDARISF